MKVIETNLKSVLYGALTGSVNGLFGGGGGMVAVPLLKNLSGYGEKRAHATAILVIAHVCAVSALVYIFGGYFHADIVVPTAIGATVGGFLGAKLLGVLPEFAVNIIFIALMLTAGIRMLI